MLEGRYLFFQINESNGLMQEAIKQIYIMDLSGNNSILSLRLKMKVSKMKEKYNNVWTSIRPYLKINGKYENDSLEFGARTPN